MKIFYYGLVLLCSVTLWGCSKGNTNAPATIDPATGKHAVANWVSPTVHGGLDFGASKNMGACQECHGNDFAGGISKVSCLNTSGCHGVGVFSPHPQKPWRGGGLITHTLVNVDNALVCAACHTKGQNLSTPILSSYATGAPGCFNSTLCHGEVGHANDPQPWSAPANHGANPGLIGRPGAKFSIAACQPCHAVPSTGQNPLFTVPKTGMPGGCSSAGCHDQNINLAHPFVWLPNRVAGITTSHATAGDLSNSCGLCHGIALNGVGGVPSAPTCFGPGSSKTFGAITLRCHATSPAAAPINCTSCHSSPPNGTVSPNQANAHTAHWAIPGLAAIANFGGCDTCHNGNGFGKATHADGTVNVALSPTFQAKTGGAATFDPNLVRCSNVSCHGGQITPPWTTGTINVNTDCNNCHILGTTQFNSYNSGRFTDPGPPATIVNLHDFHLNSVGLVCTDCHNTSNLAVNHFTHLETQIMEGPASATIGGGTTSVTTYVAGVPGSGSCTPSPTSPCHATRTW
ncbi:MAG: CxxxxCH/CxxCH domain-containing protein [Desulfuromonadales bacterium]|nr:CxxxxCH/CxxCH domain-containing protein [Desulfuromonadales bacterium]